VIETTQKTDGNYLERLHSCSFYPQIRLKTKLQDSENGITKNKNAKETLI